MRSRISLPNIHRFLTAALLVFISFAALPGPAHAADDTSILKRIGSLFLKENLDSAKSKEEMAKRVGISVSELEQICKTLGIDLGRFTPRTDTNLARTIERLKSDDYDPEAIVSFAGSSPYALLVEKSTHTVFLLKYEGRKRSLVAMYDCKTGMETGDKQVQGDLKTPEGIYFFQEKLPRNTIAARVGRGNAFQYGDMAFTTDYPNDIDQSKRKNGDGIWLHGTDEEFTATSALDTHGCVVTTNESIRELAKYITLDRTPIIIVEEIAFLTRAEHDKLRTEMQDLLASWRDSWQTENLDKYISCYASEFTDRNRNLAQWREYKKGVFSAVSVKKIELTDVVLLKHPQGLVFQFNQYYSASNLTSRNVKALYLVQQNASWKILAEVIQ